ncbi:tRNA pseudouridine(38-40) synthase TruA [Antarcticibacterium arcticum]|uniref:tRNA pseudouridine synthase A n=1 Tax=Antarcticibacterium arcticum TaxID=2585771 RepID=A0A5B8YPQ2_9FLAO|nr:tRNA pseudouridine(38-40) synthase TruA [Antarcticibacterium arcticum]QED37869.1 tRNA pseudouridine(38-40) synthase TruA [Antarcticibacterium arcticum]
MRYFIELAYNGKCYHGWQYQPAAVSVQETLEKSLFTILQQETPVVGAGRTDTGVHASQYFAHFDSVEIKDGKSFLYKLNSVLPADISVKDLFEVHPEAHARFDAVSRSYKYYIIQHKDPFLAERAHFVKNELDLERMNRAAATLKDYTDFKCFSKSKTDVKTYNCSIMHAQWKKEQEMWVFHITADRFLRNMVRAIVGTLLEIGLHKLDVEDLHRILESRDRQQAGTSVPAKALFLTGIDYPATIVKN